MIALTGTLGAEWTSSERMTKVIVQQMTSFTKEDSLTFGVAVCSQTTSASNLWRSGMVAKWLATNKMDINYSGILWPREIITGNQFVRYRVGDLPKR